MNTTLFLRFYNQTSDRISECLKRLSAFGQWLSERRRPLFKTRNATEVVLTFDSRKKLYRFFENRNVRHIYTKYLTGDPT